MLPIDALLPQVEETLQSHACLVLRAATGAGKTTRVPPTVLAALQAQGLGGRVIMLEPRRIAARAAARRIAVENGWSVGEEVGYQVRFERRSSASTRILVVTEGILVRQLQEDPFLDGVAALIFDEFHERRLDSDLALALARRVQTEVRPELRLVVMSATLDAGPVAAFLGDCPLLESAGRSFPVQVDYLPSPPEEPLWRSPQLVAAGIRRLLADERLSETASEEQPGDLLAFLPGVGEIHRCADLLSDTVASDPALVLQPLYGDLPGEQQDAALRPDPQGRRRIVLATNVAESSVTVEGIAGVVDSGLARSLRYDPSSGLDRLQLGRISQASAEQRRGRAGRQRAGVCLRLWSEFEHQGLPAHDTPEVRRVDLAGPALQLLAWGEEPCDFEWYQAPDVAALAAARDLLYRLGALDGPSSTGLTPLGRALVRLPLHPRLGRLLQACHGWGYTDGGALLAALLAERPPFRRRSAKGQSSQRGEERPVPVSESDLLERLEVLRRFARSGRDPGSPYGPLLQGPARQILRAADQLAALLRRESQEVRRESQGVRRESELAPSESRAPDADRPSSEDEALGRALLAAFPDRLVRRRSEDPERGVMLGGRGVRLAPESGLRSLTDNELFVAVELTEGRHAEALVRQASAVHRDWLAPRFLDTREEVAFDRERQRVLATRRTTWQGLVIDEVACPVSDGEQAASVLAAAAQEVLQEALPHDAPEVAGFLTRLRCLAAWRPELQLPRYDQDELRELLPTLCSGKRSFAELRRVSLLEVLEGGLDWPQRQALDRDAPDRLPLPSGSKVRLQYEEGKPPVLAARIQELFGLGETPRVAGGKVPVLLHLLAPNMRPQQVTEDLESFWHNTYPQVRKELQGRYPKHAWPEDPWTATPERRPQRRR